MLRFSEGFFQEETVGGFHIEAMMKCAWAAQLEVLEVLREFCQKHDIVYYADWGTLLGAVRHKGFIPWDDDIDICMLRKDYECFLELIDSGLPEAYHVMNGYNSGSWRNPFTRIVNATTISYSAERLQKFHGCPYAVGIDIFPLDVLPENPEDEKFQCELFAALLSNAEKTEEHMEEVMAGLTELEERYGLYFDRNENIKNQLMKAVSRVSSLYSNTNAPYMTTLCFYVSKHYYLNREWYRDVVWLPFENVMVPAPVDYKEVLTALYGEDYMTPKYEPDHEYPFYKKQNDALAEALASKKMTGSLTVDFF